MRNRGPSMFLLIGAWPLVVHGGIPPGEVVTYQGQLKMNGAPFNGDVDLAVTLWDAEKGGVQVDGPIGQDTTVRNGLFSIRLDFPSASWSGGRRWLEISINGTPMFPRQEVTHAPLAIKTRGIDVDDSGRVGIGTDRPRTELDVRGSLTLDAGGSPGLFTGTGFEEFNRYLFLLNSPQFLSASGLKAGGVLVADSFSYANPGKNDLVVKGRVGVGVATPVYALDVNSPNGIRLGLQANGGGALVLANNTGDNRIYLEGYNANANGSAAEMLMTGFAGGRIPRITLRADTTAVEGEVNAVGGLVNIANVQGGYLETFSNNGNRRILLTHPTGVPNNGFISVGHPGNVFQGAFWVDSQNQSRLFTDVKHFREMNPADPTTDIVYACIEGPEAAMYARGTETLKKGRATISLPDHFRALASPRGLTVQLTPLSAESKGLATTRKGLDGVEVQELLGGTGNYEFDWEVKAVRQKHEDYRVVQPWDAAQPAGIDREEAWQSRLRLIQDSKNR